MQRSHPPRFPAADGRLSPKALRRSRNRRAAAARDPHHRKAALVGAVGAEAEQAVDAGKARRIGQRFRRKTLPALRSRQRGDQRDRVIGERCGTHGIGAVFGAVAAGESCGSPTDPARHRARPATTELANTRGLSHRPVPSNWMLRKFAPAAVSASAVATTESPSSAMNKRIRRPSDLRHRPRRGRAIGAVFLERDDAPALAADRLLERRLHHIAIGVVGQQRGERSLSDAGGIIDDPVDVGFRQEAQEIDAASGDAGIGRERDHRNAARARQLRGRRHRQRKQRTQNDLRAFVERLLGDLLRALRAAAVILDQKLDVRVLEFRQRHLGGVLHRLRGDAGIAGGRKRQDQADLDLPGADRKRLLLRAGGPGSGPAPNGLENWLGSAARRRRPPSSGAPRIRPTAVRRVASRDRDPWDPDLRIERAHHLVSSLDRPRSARTSLSD